MSETIHVVDRKLEILSSFFREKSALSMAETANQGDSSKSMIYKVRACLKNPVFPPLIQKNLSKQQVHPNPHYLVTKEETLEQGILEREQTIYPHPMLIDTERLQQQEYLTSTGKTIFACAAVKQVRRLFKPIPAHSFQNSRSGFNKVENLSYSHFPIYSFPYTSGS